MCTSISRINGLYENYIPSSGVIFQDDLVRIKAERLYRDGAHIFP